MEELNERFDPGFVPPDDAFYITLTSTNELAAARNLEKLDSSPGDAAWSMVPRSPAPSTALPARRGNPEVQEGRQVMLVNNDKAGRWVNGTIGRVSGIEKERALKPTVMVSCMTARWSK